MSIATLPDSEAIEHLDFDPECQNPRGRCDNAAEWAVLMCPECGHTLLVCDPCWQAVATRIARGEWQGRYCGKCDAMYIPPPTARRIA